MFKILPNFIIVKTKIYEGSAFVQRGGNEVDLEGCIWFSSSKNSEHNTNLNADNNIQLIYSNPIKMGFLTVFGRAIITTDRAFLTHYYSSLDESWFSGIDYQNLTAIKVIPILAHYWENQNRKFVSLLNMESGIVSNKKKSLGKQGNLNIHFINRPINH